MIWLGLGTSSHPVGEGSGKIVFWLPALVSTEMAGDVSSSCQKYLFFVATNMAGNSSQGFPKKKKRNEVVSYLELS